MWVDVYNTGILKGEHSHRIEYREKNIDVWAWQSGFYAEKPNPVDLVNSIWNSCDVQVCILMNSAVLVAWQQKKILPHSLSVTQNNPGIWRGRSEV